MNKTKAIMIARRVCKNAEKNYDNKPFLYKAMKINNMYIVSDSHRAIRYNQDWGFEIYNDAESKNKELYDYFCNKITGYFIIPSIIGYVNKENELSLPSIEKLKDNIDMQKKAKVRIPTYYCYGKRDDNICCKLNASYLKDMIDLFGKDIKAYWDGKDSNPVYFTDGNTTEAVLMVIRKDNK